MTDKTTTFGDGPSLTIEPAGVAIIAALIVAVGVWAWTR